jgi:hypothetical protein
MEKHFEATMLALTHQICYALFMHKGDREGALALIHRIIGRDKEKTLLHSLSSSLSTWNLLLEDHRRIEKVLKKYPNGPLLKALDVFHQRLDIKGFDPIRQGNLPCYLFQFSDGVVDTKCIRLPSPTFQEKIDHAEVTPEFKGFLRHLVAEKKTCLLINFQDVTSWEEHARCKAIFDLQKEEEFAKHFQIMTLAKDTDFYFQRENYIDLHDAKQFIKCLLEQIESGESCGYFFSSLTKKELKPFLEKTAH